MASRARTKRAVRATNSAFAAVGSSLAKSTSLGMTSARVIDERMALLAKAVLDPGNADHEEFHKMVSEKLEAFALSGSILARRSVGMMGEVATFAAEEAAIANRAAISAQRCRSVDALARLQQAYAVGWFHRVYAQSMKLSDMALRSHEAAMVPVRRAARRNATRLGT